MTRARLLPPRIRAGTGLAIACLALLLCAPAQAGRPGRPTVKQQSPAAVRVNPPTPAVTPVPAAPSAGLVMSLEPGTGRLVMPSPEEMLLLTPAERTGLLRTSAGLSEIQGPGGAIGVDLQGRFMEFTVVRLDLQGRLHFVCVDEAPALLRLLHPRTPAPAPAWEER